MDDSEFTRRDLLWLSATVGTSAAAGFALRHGFGEGDLLDGPGYSLDGARFVPATTSQELRSALAAVGSRPARVVIGPGTIEDVRDSLVVPSNTWLQGAGRAATTLRFADDAALETAGLLRVEGTNVVVSDLGLEGNRGAVPLSGGSLGREYGVYAAGARNLTCARIAVRRFAGYGIDPHADGSRPAERVVVIDCLSEGNGLDGITLAGVSGGLVANNLAVDNDRHGVAVTDREARDVTVTGNLSRDNGACGFVAQNHATTITATGNLFCQNGRDGVRLGSASGPVGEAVVSSNVVRANGQYAVNVRRSRGATVASNLLISNGTGGDVTAAVVLDAPDVRDTIVTANQVRTGSGTAHGVDERPGGGPSVVGLNIVRGASDVPIRTTHPASTTGLNSP